MHGKVKDTIVAARVAMLVLAGLFCAEWTAAATAGTERVTVVAVRIFVNDVRYDWREDGPLPDRAEGGFTEPSTVASFLGVRPGEEMDADELASRRSRAEERLVASGYFYAAQVLVVPASSRPDGRLLVVKVKEGFLWRFGGGAYYAMVGQDNAFGAEKSWRAYAGYNLDGLLWQDNAVSGGPFRYTAGFLYMNDLGAGFVDSHAFSLPLSAGITVSPDAAVSLESPLTYRLVMADSSPGIALYPDTGDGLEWAPGVSFKAETSLHPGGVRISLGTDASAALVLSSTGASRGQAEAEAYAGVATWPEVRLRASGGAALPVTSGLPAYSLYDLADTPSRAVRAGYGSLELLASRYAMASAELRFPLPRIPLGSVFSLSLAPFLYADGALALTAGDGTWRDLEGFGLGARIGLENPVFAYFSLSYGWNPQGNGRFCFFAVSKDQ